VDAHERRDTFTMNPTAMLFENPNSPAAAGLNALVGDYQRVAGELRDAEHAATFASREQQQASESLADLERRRARGEPVSDAERKRAEKALADARARAAEPWAERRRGLASAVRDMEGQLQRYVSEHWDELAGELAERAEEVKVRVDSALQSVLDVYAERQRVAQHATVLLGQVQQPRPNSVPYTKLQGVAREIGAVLLAGGEVAPVATRRVPENAEQVPA
jgi:hypothetical protein